MSLAAEPAPGTGQSLAGPAPQSPRRAGAGLTLTLVLALLAVTALSLGHGAAGTRLGPVLADLWAGRDLAPRDRIVLLDIRLPRLVLGLCVGAGLAVSGAVMQGLFRNPLADPGLVGVGAGAGLGAILAIVLGGLLPAAVATALGGWLVPVAAALGGWVTTVVLYRLATRQGQTSVATLLLAGVALAALAGAISGVLVYRADDAQLRDLTFWGMGALTGASWSRVLVAAPMIGTAVLAAPLLARGLNGLALGEAAAAHTGVPVQQVKRGAVAVVALATGAAVAAAGGIGFVGIVVPHLLRLAAGPDHHRLLPHAALLGAVLLVAADLLARSLVAPAELPIGIVTATLGAPVFLWILLRQGPNRGI